MDNGTIELTHRVGRLIETRLRGSLSLADVGKILEQAQAVYTAPIDRFLSVVDLRDTQAHDDEIVQPLLQLLKSVNPRIDRVGFLIGNDSLLAVQIESMVISARHPGRRVFRDPQGLIDYLGEVTTPAEQQRLRDFLAERYPALPED
jgi:hypothetical protein